MTTTVHVLDAAGLMEPDRRQELTNVAEGAARDAGQDLGTEAADVVVCDYPGLALPGIGVGGYCPGPHLVFVAVEPASMREQWREDVASTVTHELHHARRWQGPGYGARLIDSMVSEGLATLYEIERTGHTPPYTHVGGDPDADVFEAWWQRAEPLLDRTDLHAPWFFGTGPAAGADVIPHWTGYALGTELARRFCARVGLSAREAVDAAADDVRRAW
jgi:uncharacterized protein YjaZ